MNTASIGVQVIKVHMMSGLFLSTPSFGKSGENAKRQLRIFLCKRAEEYHVRVRCTSDRVKNTRDIDDGIIEMCKREGPVLINAAKAFCYIYYSERRFIDDVIKEVEDLFQYENYVEFGSCYGDWNWSDKENIQDKVWQWDWLTFYDERIDKKWKQEGHTIDGSSGNWY